MNILLISHAAWRHTGYGTPVIPFVKQMRKHGHDVAVLAIEERGPGRMEYKGITHYLPTPAFRFGEDIADGCARDFGAQVVISLIDPWVFNRPMKFKEAKWIAWCPVDQFPPQNGLIDRFQSADLVLSFSEWGERTLRKYAPDLNVSHMPIGVDLAQFRDLGETARDQFRAGIGGIEELATEPFLVGMVGSNVHHDRKALRENIAGFCKFAARHDDAFMLMWAHSSGGVDLKKYLTEFDLGHRVSLVNDWEIVFGGHTQRLVEFYNHLDVLLHASAAEGFGLPIIEAQACGVPVIGAENTSMTELIANRVGYLVSQTTPEWSWLNGWWMRPTPEGVAEALEWAYDEIKHTGIKRPHRDDCIGWARQFDWEIVGERWAEVLAAYG